MAVRMVADRYRLTKRIASGDSVRGIPELWEAEDAGDTYYVKVWQRPQAEGEAIRALWNREVRSLTRLQGYPGAGEMFVRLVDLRFDDAGYYAVIEGERLLLSRVLETRAQHAWLRNLSETGRRRPLWEGLLRVGEAISLLHSEGTLHRSIGPRAVFVDGAGRGEFRLSGFEWSLRVAASEPSSKPRRQGLMAPELERAAPEYSTATDWFDFGILACALFGITLDVHKKRESLRAAVSSFANFRESERALIQQLISEEAEERTTDAETVLGNIREVIRELGTVTTAASRPLMLAIRLGQNSEFTRAIERASEGAAPASNALAQRDWVRQDLRGDVRVTARQRPYPQYILRGAKLQYRATQWGDASNKSWEIAFCDALEQYPRVADGDRLSSLGIRSLEVELYPTVRQNFRTLRDRAAAWDKVFPFGLRRRALAPYLKDIHDFFRVTQQIDALLVAAQICPVEIVEVERSDAETQVTVTPFEEPSRNDLAAHLGLDRPSAQLRDWVRLGAEAFTVEDDGTDPDRVVYNLLDRRTIDGDTRSVNWKLRGADPHSTGARYTFWTESNLTIHEGRRMYLARNHGGLLAQIRRRHRAIEDLGWHEDLLKLLADPRGRLRVTGDALPSPVASIPLDESKVEALTRLWSHQPSFAIQGPPGTGKTTLIRAFVDRLYGDDSSAQILVSAHSHHTVDDVRLKVAKLFQGRGVADRPIVVRLGARNPTDHDLTVVAQEIIESLALSKMAKDAPKFLQERLIGLTEGDGQNDERRTLELLVQDSANITFATSNSEELAELAVSGRRFDWSLIEEAGKAHGFDMAAALQLSHRLLLIGDHHQLPPFNAKRYRDLLAEPLRVKKAFETGAPFAPGLVDSALVEEEEDRREFVERCAEWKGLVDLFGQFFERSYSVEPNSSLADTLTQQHRMHPDIAQIVGEVFYPSEDGSTILKSPKEVHAEFAKPPPFSIAAGSWLPDQRVVWCNVPWIQKTEFADGEAQGLFCAPREAEAVVKVLGEIRAVEGRSCEIQLLSPYSNQVGLIRAKVEEARAVGGMPDMFSPPFLISENKRSGRTVDEFQGSEADVVIVSLVRNNALTPWKSLGFLKDSSRMNVLLSRARQKLIVVGSWDFFDSRTLGGVVEELEFEYIGRMMAVLKRARISGSLGFVEM